MRSFSFFVDRGGTFTDVVAAIEAPDGASRLVVGKLLSVDPANYDDAPTEGIRRLLEQETGITHPRGVPLDTSRIKEIRMGTTVATNALLERRGERMAFAVTSGASRRRRRRCRAPALTAAAAGFRDLLYIGNQARPRIFDLEVHCPDTLYEVVVEIDELVGIPLGDEPSARNGAAGALRPTLAGRQVLAGTGERLVVRRPLRQDVVRAQLAAVAATGVRSLAVCLKHAALYPEHELEVGAIASELGFTHVSLSHTLLRAVKMVPRGFTAAADAYLTPAIGRYLSTFAAGFDDGLGSRARLSFMQSDGGLTDAASFCGHRAILSGPAGGVVGFAHTTAWAGGPPLAAQQLVGFDMGGTSTDVCRVARGVPEHVFEATVAGVTIAAPQLDVTTVAAGGGSVLSFRCGILAVGPDSVGADPGPACYRKSGTRLAVTDANLFLGRLAPEHFPHIFGPGEDQPLDVRASADLFEQLVATANEELPPGAPQMTADSLAAGFIAVANEAMCRPIRQITNMRGHDAGAHTLACFGGAGGQHACAVARSLGIRTVFVHRLASVLSALGIGMAERVAEAREPAAQRPLGGASLADELEPRFAALEEAAAAALVAQGFARAAVTTQRFLNLRFEGTDSALMISCPDDGDYSTSFLARYAAEFGFTLQRRVLVDDLRVRARCAGAAPPVTEAGEGDGPPPPPPPLPPPLSHAQTYFSGRGRVATPVYSLSALHPGNVVTGPALLVDAISTLLVEPDCVAAITADRNLVVDVPPAAQAGSGGGGGSADLACDPVQLSIFGHRFMGIAEQMGRTLQRTAVSVNIKERLDFSCALFGPDGGLVANAPHLPVHLGAMQEAVRFQLAHAAAGEPLQPGDVLLSNHPQLAGGSHLPDMTVITPVFEAGLIVFFVASRGHHADIGGLTPGSMPPHSTLLAQEGAAIVSFKLLRRGVFDEGGVSEILSAPGELADCPGTRCLSDNLSDLRAQVAANERGITLVRELIAEHSLPVVQAYMGHIQLAAERAVRSMLADFSRARGLAAGGGSVFAEDFLDDGTPIRLRVAITRGEGDAGATAVFDFAGTGPQVAGNLNAPRAVTYSAVIYALRCLLHADVPLNQGCLTPVQILIPPGCVLHPGPEAAVVGGNVLTSQRVTDVVLRAFGAAADSQGCMNNTTFGDSSFGYYETVCGGAGAGPGWAGRSGVQVHMTNTRITDPETLEMRYPVALRAFRLRPGSGGAGRWPGGCGALRELEMLRPLTVGVLCERRARPPRGLAGGGDAAPGMNLWLQAPPDCDALLSPGAELGAQEVPPALPGGRVVNLGGKATVAMRAGDRLRLLTPGGGGYGATEEPPAVI